jgi:Zn-dependent protease
MKKTAKCKQCGEEVVMPFKCTYCGGLFCGEHRLPERHNCPEAWRAKAPRDVLPVHTPSEVSTPSYQYSVSFAPPTAKVYGFSTTELKHLAIGALLVMGVGLSYFLTATRGADILTLGALSVAFMLSFILHELAHKFSAQRFNLWAEFRLTMQGALITLVSIFLPFKLISPGAVMIAGTGTRATVGKTAIAGPITNIVLSTVCIGLAALNQSIFLIVAFINAFLAVFNMIPFGVFDGLKVFRWNKTYWTAVFTVALVLTVYTYGSVI